MNRIVTAGSVWLIDENRYCRMPLDEHGRERPEWGNAEAGVLQDLVWHPLDWWLIAPAGTLTTLANGRHATRPGDQLNPDGLPLIDRLWISSDGKVISAPNPESTQTRTTCDARVN